MKENFSDWKRPRLRWLPAVGAVLQLVCLWMNVQEYVQVRSAGVLSAEAFREYAAEVWLRCALEGTMAVLFAGSFFIGTLARSRRTARRCEGVLFLAAALGWGVGGLLGPAGEKWVWGVFFVLLAAAGAWSLGRARRSQREETA